MFKICVILHLLGTFVMISTCSMGKKFLVTKGGSIKKFLGTRGGVNKVSGRRGDSDFTLQEGGNGTLPPPCPRMVL